MNVTCQEKAILRFAPIVRTLICHQKRKVFGFNIFAVRDTEKVVIKTVINSRRKAVKHRYTRLVFVDMFQNNRKKHRGMPVVVPECAGNRNVFVMAERRVNALPECPHTDC